jgi:hypothetical protein
VSNKKLLIVNNEKNLNFILKKKISKELKVLTFSPNIFSLLINSKLRESTLYPNHFFKTKHHKLIIDKLLNINKKLEIDKSFDQNEKVYLRYLFQIVLSSSFFIWYSLGNQSNWYYIDKNKISKTINKKVIFNITVNQLFDNYQKNFFGQLSKYNNSLCLRLNFLLNKLNIFFLIGNFDIISNKKFSKNTNKKTLTLNKTNKLYIFKNILNIFSNIFVKNKAIEFTPSRKLSINSNNKNIVNFFDKHLKIFNSQNIIINNLSNSLAYNQEIFNLFKVLFAKSNIKNFLTDEIKYRESLVLSQYLKKYKPKTKIYLASHGTHPPLAKDKYANFQIIENSDGLLISKFADFSIIQSKISKNYITSSKINGLKKIISKPISWSVSDVSNPEKLNISKNITILHASTPKSLCSRPYLYESPFEYIENLNYLIDQLSQIKDIKLIIRPRFTPEFNFQSFKNLILKSEKVELSINNSFFTDLYRSDALISSSSTTIEEALYMKKPVLIYNCLGYNHFQFYKIKKEDPIFVLNKNKNFKKSFMKIKPLLNIKNLNYNKFIWNKAIPSFKIK